MKRKLAFIMATIMLVTTPASVLASEGMDISVVSEEAAEELAEEASVVAEEDTLPGTDAIEVIPETSEESYEIPVDMETSAGEDYSADDAVVIEDDAAVEVYSTGTDIADYGDDDFLVSIEEIPATISDETDIETEDENIRASGECGDNLTWVLDKSGVLTISGSGAMTSAPWKSKYQTSIKSVVIEEGVTSISQYAFLGCSYITNVDIPDSVTDIGDEAFENCTWLKNVTIGSGLKSIPWGLFYGCTYLETVTLSKDSQLTEIRNCAFYKCTHLKEINVPDTVSRISPYAFYDCGYLTDIHIPENLTYIGEYAFWDCTYLTTHLVFPDCFTYMGEGAFEYCTGIHEITFTGDAPTFGLYVFYGLNVTIYYPKMEFSKWTGSVRSGHSASSIKWVETEMELSDKFYNVITLLEDNFIYDGTAKTPDVASFEYSNTILTEKTDYTVSYSNNVNAGEATVTINGKGDYTGSVSTTFTIQKAEQTLIPYTESSTITIGGTTRITAAGYGEKTFSSNNSSVAEVNDTGVVTGKALGKVTITVTSSGNDNYNAASTTITITVTEDISNCAITLGKTSYTYDGSAKKPSVTVKNGSTTLKSGTDYTVSYSNNTNAGTATVTVTGKGDYTGSVKKTFTINKASQTISAKASSSSIVKGKTATITASGKGTISYSSNKKSVATVSTEGKITTKAIGTAKITVKAAGNSNYKSASKTLTIKVIPKATTLKSAKSSSSKKLTVKWKKVSGVTGYQIQYSTSKTFKSKKSVNVSGASKVSKTISNLKKGKTYYVRVRTYKKVSGTKYYSSWSSKKKVKVK